MDGKAFGVCNFAYRSQQNERARAKNRSIKINATEKRHTHKHNNKSSLHLISRNKSDLLLVKTVYLHIRWSIPLLFHFITFNIIRKLLRYNLPVKSMHSRLVKRHTHTHTHTDKHEKRVSDWYDSAWKFRISSLSWIRSTTTAAAIKPNKWCEIAFAIFAYDAVCIQFLNRQKSEKINRKLMLAHYTRR